jgi:hypothetical protein
MDGQAIEGAGLISTQFIRTPTGWMMTSMAWDDERPGLAIPDRYTVRPPVIGPEDGSHPPGPRIQDAGAS